MSSQAMKNLDFSIRLDTVLESSDPSFIWYHPRVAVIPAKEAGGVPRVVMTLQKHLKTSDYYSGLYYMLTDDLGEHWTAPIYTPELDWVKESDKVDVAVADVTPGWHSPTGKVLAIGAQVRYSSTGEQMEDRPRSHQTAYSVYDPGADTWTTWQVLEVPDEDIFNFARNACSQWLVNKDGNLLVPLYISRSTKEPFSVTVAEYSFDGERLSYVRHGNILKLDIERGFCEPSLTQCEGRYFLTLRNDLKAYVTTSEDGLTFTVPQPWTFDDGTELGSWNTQQHWITHSGGLYLVYTRKGADNDHIPRNRAPLFIARVDTENLQVIRKTERVLIPEEGSELGNFGASAVTPNESWVTVGEGIWDDAPKRKEPPMIYAARIKWNETKRNERAG